MGNTGTFTLELRDALDHLANDPRTTVRFFRARDNGLVQAFNNLVFPPARQFTLPAFPQEINLTCEVRPFRYRAANTGFFTLRSSVPRSESVTALRLPDKWKPEFALWDSLSSDFTSLKTVLGRSPGIRVKDGEHFDQFVEGTYDDITDQKTILAKMALLNLYFALTTIIEPTNGRDSWFSFVNRIFLIDRERFMAFVPPEMRTVVQMIHDNVGRFPDYKQTNASNHMDGIRRALPAGFTLQGSGVSIKNKPEHANIQLTMAEARDSNGNVSTVLDADIDENGKLLEHLADLVKHAITGGTHPIDIHEYLLLAYRDIALGYDLVELA